MSKKKKRAESQNYIYKDIVYYKNVCTQYNREGKKYRYYDKCDIYIYIMFNASTCFAKTAIERVSIIFSSIHGYLAY